MIAWIRKQDPYAIFLWIVLGVPLLGALWLLLGSLSIMLWNDEGWAVIPISLFSTAGVAFLMGNMGEPKIQSAKEYCMWWGAMTGFVFIAFVIPALLISLVRWMI